MQLFLKDPAKIIWNEDAPEPLERPLYMPEKPSLVYIIAFDAPNSESNRYLAKMLVSSLLRTFFTGDIVVFRNSPQPLFFVERKGLEEIFVEAEQLTGRAGAEDAWCWKYRVAEMLGDVSGYDKVLFLDADFLALRNIDELLAGTWDIRYQPERHHPLTERSFRAYFAPGELDQLRAATAGYEITEWNNPQGYEYYRKGDLPVTFTGVNSGSLAVRAEVFQAVMQKWREIDEGTRYGVKDGFWDQASWNALLMRHTSKGCFQGSDVSFQKTEGGEAESLAQRPEICQLGTENSPKWTAEPFPDGEICFPMYLDPHWHRYRHAALLHNCGGDTLQKIRLTFSLYMGTFFGDPSGVFFSVLET